MSKDDAHNQQHQYVQLDPLTTSQCDYHLN